MKKFIHEFKAFALRGNVMDLAVGVIIGGAFQAIVTSMINDLIMPFIGLITGGVNFKDQFVILKNTTAVANEAITSIDQAASLGVTTFNYGSFITAVINFLIMALVIFTMVKAINRLATFGKKEEPKAEPEPTTKKCPFCCTEIDIKACRCPNCTSELTAEELPATE